MSVLRPRNGLTEEEMQPFQPVHDTSGVPCYLDIAILQCRHMRLVVQDAEMFDHYARVGQSTMKHMTKVPVDVLSTPETVPMMDPYCVLEHRGQIKETKPAKGTMDPVWQESFRFQTIDCSMREDSDGCIVEPTQEEREENPPQLERVVIHVKNACARTKAKHTLLGQAILSPTALATLLISDRPSWVALIDEGGQVLTNDLGVRTDIMVRARISVFRKSTLTLAVFHAHDIGTGAHWNGFTQPDLGGVYLIIKHRRERRKSKISHQMCWNEEYHFDLGSEGNHRTLPGDVTVEMRCSPKSGGFILGACKLSASSTLRIGRAWVGWVHVDPEANMSNIKDMPASRFMKEALNLQTPKLAVMLTWRNFHDDIPHYLWDLGAKVTERVAQEAYAASRIDKSVSQLAPLDKEITARIKQMYNMRYNSKGGAQHAGFERASSQGEVFGRVGSSHSVHFEIDDTLEFTETKQNTGEAGHQTGEVAAPKQNSLLDGIVSVLAGGGKGLESCVTNLMSGSTSMPCFWEGNAKHLHGALEGDDDEEEEEEEEEVGGKGKQVRSEVEEKRFRQWERRGSLIEVAQLPADELPVTTGDMFLGVMLPEEYHF